MQSYYNYSTKQLATSVANLAVTRFGFTLKSMNEAFSYLAVRRHRLGLTTNEQKFSLASNVLETALHEIAHVIVEDHDSMTIHPEGSSVKRNFPGEMNEAATIALHTLVDRSFEYPGKRWSLKARIKASGMRINKVYPVVKFAMGDSDLVYHGRNLRHLIINNVSNQDPAVLDHFRKYLNTWA